MTLSGITWEETKIGNTTASGISSGALRLAFLYSGFSFHIFRLAPFFMAWFLVGWSLHTSALRAGGEKRGGGWAGFLS